MHTDNPERQNNNLPQIQKKSFFGSRLTDGTAYSRFGNKWAVVVLFFLLIIILPFYESKRVIMWDLQRNQERFNPFRYMVLAYAVNAEAIKQDLKLDTVFEKEELLWLKIKEFPVALSPRIIFNNGNIKKIENVGTSKENQGLEINGNQPQTEQDKAPVPDTSTVSDAPTIINEETQSKISPPFRFLLIGDSFMGTYSAIGDLLEEELLKYKDTTVNRFGKVSSGLSRPDFFDWNEKALELTSLYNPNIVIIMMGLNDDQSLVLTDQAGKKVYLKFGTSEWQEEYGRRMDGFLRIFSDRSTAVFWIGLPVMRDESFSERVKIINLIYEEHINNSQNFYFIPTWSLLCDSAGNDAAFLPDRNGQYKATRVSDGIHLTFFAGNIVLEKILEQIGSKLSLEPLK